MNTSTSYALLVLLVIPKANHVKVCGSVIEFTLGVGNPVWCLPLVYYCEGYIANVLLAEVNWIPEAWHMKVKTWIQFKRYDAELIIAFAQANSIMKLTTLKN